MYVIDGNCWELKGVIREEYEEIETLAYFKWEQSWGFESQWRNFPRWKLVTIAFCVAYGSNFIGSTKSKGRVWLGGGIKFKKELSLNHLFMDDLQTLLKFYL